MKITKYGNMLDVTEGIIVHGCNAQGVMNSGIARDIKVMYPDNFNKYYVHCKKTNPNDILGTVVFWDSDKLTVANAITQLNYGRNPNIRYVDYDAIRDAFKLTIAKAIRTGQAINYPTIGAGLGNGDWDIIEDIIDTEFDKVSNDIFGNELIRTHWIFK